MITQRKIDIIIDNIHVFVRKAEKWLGEESERYMHEKLFLQAEEVKQKQENEEKYHTKSQQVSRDITGWMKEVEQLRKEIVFLQSQNTWGAKDAIAGLESIGNTLNRNTEKVCDWYEPGMSSELVVARIREQYQKFRKKYNRTEWIDQSEKLSKVLVPKKIGDYFQLKSLIATLDKELVKIRLEVTQNQAKKMMQVMFEKQAAQQQLFNKFKSENDKCEQVHAEKMNAIKDRICAEYARAFSEKNRTEVKQLLEQHREWERKVHCGPIENDQTLELLYVNIPLAELTQNEILAGIIREQSEGFCDDNKLRFPLVVTPMDATAWMVEYEGTSENMTRECVWTSMLNLIYSLPVGRCRFHVFDSQNKEQRWNYFSTLQHFIPLLFGEKKYVSGQEYEQKLEQLKRTIERTIQEKLTDQFETIFEYEKNETEFTMCETLLIYDFPKGFNESSLEKLQYILKYGYRCGVYAVILEDTAAEAQLPAYIQNKVLQIKEETHIIRQEEYFPTLMSYPLALADVPPIQRLNEMAKEYILCYQFVEKQKLQISPYIYELRKENDSEKAEQEIQHLSDMLHSYGTSYGKKPNDAKEIPQSLMFGTFSCPDKVFEGCEVQSRMQNEFRQTEDHVEIPFTLDLRNACNFLLEGKKEDRQELLKLSHHIIWTYLSFIPVSGLNVCVFDKEKKGNSILPLLDFRKQCPELFDDKIYTSADEMYERLKRLAQQMDETIQEKLSNRYENIIEYNQHTVIRKEKITLLALYDFPSGMDARSLEILSDIIRNGNKCGIYVLICSNPEMEDNGFEQWKQQHLTNKFFVLHYVENQYYLPKQQFLFDILQTPSLEMTSAFSKEYVEMLQRLKKKSLNFDDILPQEYFSKTSSDYLHIPIGIGGEDKVVEMKFGLNASHHGLIIGATGSGKSTLLHTVIMSGMLLYSPEELHLYLMDFKSGTEFKIYDTVRLPHIQLLAIDTMQEFGRSILENLVEEMERRARLFKEAEQTSLKGYKEATGEKLPRILIVMDEFQILFNDSENRKIANECAEITKRIVTEGRAFGIHLLMATQSTNVLSGLTLSRGIIEQIRVRVGLKCAESDVRYLFGDEKAQNALDMMKGSIGTAVLDQDYMESQLEGLKIAYCNPEEQMNYLKIISEKYAHVPGKTQIFEGGRNEKLLDYFKENQIGMSDTTPAAISVGSLIKVAPPLQIQLDKKRKHNMLICGSNEKMMNRIMDNYMIGAVMNRKVGCYCIDGNYLVDDFSSREIYELLERRSGRFHVAEDRGDIIRFIKEVYEIYKSRKKINTGETTLVFIKNLQFLDVVQTMLKGEYLDESDYLIEDEPLQDTAEEAFAFVNPFAGIQRELNSSRRSVDEIAVGEMLLKMIQNGSGFGIHFIVSSMEYQIVKEVLWYGENVLAKFPERIVFSLSDSDADNLINDVGMSGLRDNTVYYSDGIKNTFQIKPFISPTLEELETII